MPLQTFEITADVPEGFEPTGEFRGVNKGEHYITMLGDVLLSTGDDPHSEQPRIILRPAWQWPEHIPAGTWYCQGAQGWHYLSLDEPVPCVNGWRTEGVYLCLDIAQAKMIGFTPPPCSDFRQSKRQKPEGK